jgi:hypothetical protein
MSGIALTAPLPLSAAERGITRSASQTLAKVYADVGKRIRSGIKTPEALAIFWETLRDLAARNAVVTRAVLAAGTAGNSDTAAVADVRGNGIRNAAKRKTSAPGTKAKARTRTAGA